MARGVEMGKQLIASAIFFFAGLYFINDGYHNYSRYSELKKSGVTVMSEPFKDYVEYKRNGKVENYYIKPPFKNNKGNTYTCDGHVDKPIIDTLQGNPVIEVRYLPNDPSTCQIKGAEDKGGMTMLLLGLVMAVGGGAFLFNLLSTLRKK